MGEGPELCAFHGAFGWPPWGSRILEQMDLLSDPVGLLLYSYISELNVCIDVYA